MGAGPAAEPIVDVEADEIVDNTPEAGTDLAVVAQTAGAIIRAEQPDEILAKAGQIATALGKLIEDQGLAVNVGGRKKHVEVGGWQALGAMLGALGGQPLHAETVWTRKVAGPDGAPVRTTYTAMVKRYHRKADGGGLREEVTYDVDGFDWEARVEIRTPDGTVVGSADAMVSRTEETWNQRDDFALRSMAETRAESRAYRRACGWIIHMAGYSPTPAEEMGHTPGADSMPSWAEPASKELKKAALSWVVSLLERAGANGESKTKAIAALQELAGHSGGELSDIAAKTAIRLGQMVDKTAAAAPAADDPSAETGPGDGSSDLPPSGSVVVEGTPAAENRPDAVDLDAARRLCTCEGGYDAAEIRRADQGTLSTGTKLDDACPIINHGIPF